MREGRRRVRRERRYAAHPLKMCALPTARRPSGAHQLACAEPGQSLVHRARVSTGQARRRREGAGEWELGSEAV